jgi:hypothetical protein
MTPSGPINFRASSRKSAESTVQGAKSRCSVKTSTGSLSCTARTHVCPIRPAASEDGPPVSQDHSLCTWVSHGNICRLWQAERPYRMRNPMWRNYQSSIADQQDSRRVPLAPSLHGGGSSRSAVGSVNLICGERQRWRVAAVFSILRSVTLTDVLERRVE